MNNSCVYLHFRKDDGLCFYVGMGRPKRPFDHANRSPYWKRVKDKHGVIVQVIYENLSSDDAVIMERSYIYHFTNSPLAKLVNLTSGGEGTKGVKNSIETRLRKSQSAIRLNADPMFKQKKLAQLQNTRTVESNIKRSNSLKNTLSDVAIRQKHMERFERNKALVEVALSKAHTVEVNAKRGQSVRCYLTDPSTRHVGLIKAALMNASRWKRPYTKLTKEYFK
jgi:hypothetical protein